MEDRAGSRADQGETRRGGLRLLPSPPGDALVRSVEAPCEGTDRSPIVPVSISAGASDLAPEDPIRVPRVAGGGGIRDPLSLSMRFGTPTNVYRATKDLYLTQRFARHSSPLTTTIYTHPSDEELYTALRGIKT